MTNAHSSDSPVLGGLKAMVLAWNRFWFNPADPTTLGFIRICAGLMVFYIHLGYSFDLEALLSRHAWLDLATVDTLRHEQPVMPPPSSWDEPQKLPPPGPQDIANELKWGSDIRREWTKGIYQWSIWFHVSDPRAMWPVHIGILIVMLCFTAGLFTRVTAVLTWLAVLSYINRAQTTIFGMDTIQNLVVLYLMIGPSGAALSLDRLIAHHLAVRRARRLHQPAPPWVRPAPSISANFAIRLLQINLCLIYLVSGLSKLQGQTWWTGNAIWLTMANPEFSPLGYRYYAAFLRLLGEHRWLYEIFVPGFTIGTLVFEITFIFLVWQNRLRWFMVLAAVLLHLGIAFFMGLVSFSMMMFVAVASFFPPATVRDFLGRLSSARSELRLVAADP